MELHNEIIGKLKELIKDLDEYNEGVNNPKDDFNYERFVGRYAEVLAIKGGRGYYLKSFNNGDIVYSNCNKELYTDDISYEKAKLSDLNKGDVFCEKLGTNLKLSDFHVYRGKCGNGINRSQYLYDRNGVELIFASSDGEDREVIRFKRDEDA